MKIKTNCYLFYDEGEGGLVVGDVDWGSNDRCWLYLDKGAVGEGDNADEEFFFEATSICTTLDPKWYEVIDE